MAHHDPDTHPDNTTTTPVTWRDVVSWETLEMTLVSMALVGAGALLGADYTANAVLAAQQNPIVTEPVWMADVVQFSRVVFLITAAAFAALVAVGLLEERIGDGF